MYRSIIKLNPRFMNHQEYHVCPGLHGKICSEELPRSGDQHLCATKSEQNYAYPPKILAQTKLRHLEPWNLNVRETRFGKRWYRNHPIQHLRVRWAIGSLKHGRWPPTCPSKRGLPAWSWMSLHKSIDLAFPRNLQSHRVYISSQAMGLWLKT